MNAAPLHVFYGGTFDPVHCGHLAVARAARDALDAKVALMPAADPPHRPPPGAGAEHRARMLELALAGEPGLCVDRRELQRTGPSYSVDTLLALRAELGADASVVLLVGADSFRGLPAWHRWRELFGLAHFVVAERPGSPLDRGLDEPLASAIAGRLVETPAALRAAPAGRIWRLQQPLRPESASELRRRIAAGEPWRDWVPAMVAEYIERHGLYRPTAGAAPPAPV